MVGPTDTDVTHDPVSRWLSAASVIILILIFGWALLTTASRPSLGDRMTQVETQLVRVEERVAYIACLLVIPIEERPTRAPLECRPPAGGTP